MKLSWVESQYSPPNTRYSCIRWVLMVGDLYVAAIQGPSIAEPWFNVVQGRKRFSDLAEAKAAAMRGARIKLKRSVAQSLSAIDIITAIMKAPE